ncbi:hypothetical protein HOP50_05g39420 [Chloropicon primus]|nr:hypothetical protein HOP50_05g39420 [Chloropicon primus]
MARTRAATRCERRSRELVTEEGDRVVKGSRGIARGRRVKGVARPKPRGGGVVVCKKKRSDTTTTRGMVRGSVAQRYGLLLGCVVVVLALALGVALATTEEEFVLLQRRLVQEPSAPRTGLFRVQEAFQGNSILANYLFQRARESEG